MARSFLIRRFRAAVMAISLREVHLKFWKRNEPITRASTARSSILAGILSSRTETRTCRSRLEENLFPRRCTTLCDSPAPTECMPGICQAIRRHMAVFGCRNIRDCILQCSQRWHSSHGSRKNADGALHGAIATDIPMGHS